jgi:hypothetical protein
MVWLNDISAWTLVAFGLGWLGVSSVCALVLGRILARTSEAALNEERALEQAREALAFAPDARDYRVEVLVAAYEQGEQREDGSSAVDAREQNDEAVQAAGAGALLDAEEEPDAYEGRAASGTRFKPVAHDGAEDPQEDEREAVGSRYIRRIR